MRKFFTALVVIPLGLVFIIFAVANRHFVTVSFDPFNSTDPAIAVSMPLFAVIITVAILGVAAGGVATWFRQRHWRRAARLHEAEARRETGFGPKGSQGDHKLPENSKENLDEKLDNAVDETFPGSDPVSVKITK